MGKIKNQSPVLHLSWEEFRARNWDYLYCRPYCERPKICEVMCFAEDMNYWKNCIFFTPKPNEWLCTG